MHPISLHGCPTRQSQITANKLLPVCPEVFDRVVRAVMSLEGTHGKTLFSSSLARTHQLIFFFINFFHFSYICYSKAFRSNHYNPITNNINHLNHPQIKTNIILPCWAMARSLHYLAPKAVDPNPSFQRAIKVLRPHNSPSNQTSVKAHISVKRCGPVPAASPFPHQLSNQQKQNQKQTIKITTSQFNPSTHISLRQPTRKPQAYSCKSLAPMVSARC